MATPLRKTATGTVAASGAVTITFAQVPQGLAWEASVSIPSANPAASWVVEVNGTQVTQGAGPGPIELPTLNEGDVLTLLGSGVYPAGQLAAVISGSSMSTTEAAGHAPSSLVLPSAALIHPGLADLLTNASPGATSWDSGSLVLEDSYEAIAVVCTVNTPSHRIDCHLLQQSASLTTHPVQIQAGGGGGMESFYFPIDNAVGDTVDVTLGYYGALATPIVNVWVYGVRASSVPTRSDGLPMPRNAFSLSAGQNAAGTVQLLTAPGGGPPGSNARFMLTRLDVELEPPGSGVLRATVGATIKGDAITLLTCFTVANVPARKTVQWPNGLLLDWGSNLNATMAGTPGAVDWSYDYDLVAGIPN